MTKPMFGWRGLVFASVCLAVAGCKQDSTQNATHSSLQPLESALQAVQKTPGFESYTHLGLAYSKLGRHEHALEAFTKSRDINPKSPIAWNNVCVEQNNLKRFRVAIESCGKSLELEPQFQLAKNNLSYARQSLANQEKSIQALEADVRTGKNADVNRITLGMEYYARQDYDQAVKAWSGVAEKSPEFVIAQNNIASAYIMQKKLELAQKHLDEALKLQPTNQLAINNQKWLNQVKAQAH